MMTGTLGEIIQHVRGVVEKEKSQAPIEQLQERCDGLSACRGFVEAIKWEADAGRLGLIAEIKRKSPSAGRIAIDEKMLSRAALYEKKGAACISVLTEKKYFDGSVSDLEKIKKEVSVPILRKDFIIDPWQVFQARICGADCMLLIAAALATNEMHELSDLATKLGMDVLVEIHDEKEIDAALGSSATLIGVNNRNLKTLDKADIGVSEKLMPLIKKRDGRPLLSLSGIFDGVDARKMLDAGADGILVGEALMSVHPPELGDLVDDLRCL